MSASRFHPLSLEIRPAVAQAVAAGRPVVALESTVLTHGLPRPVNLETAFALENMVRENGAVPATIGVLDGRFVIGAEPPEVERLCSDPGAKKLSRRDLPAASTFGWSGGTTVSATMALAHAAGVTVFATGGIGGVHRGDTGDVSADLDELSRTPVAVVCSGAKAILDLDRTLEWLEANSVPVAGWRTDIFPEFFSVGETRRVSVRVDSEGDAARLIEAQRATGSGLLLCVPCPAAQAVPVEIVRQALVTAEHEAAAAEVTGKDVTPFLLRRVSELTSGATLAANQALLRNNAAVAARIAVAVAQRRTAG